MDDELKEKLLTILEDLPSECSWLDYKMVPYDKYQKAELIKDVCAFLNCTESYGKDKFIIIGIVDKTKYKKGTNDNRIEDDKYFQDLWELIQPRPHIETGEITVDGLIFGYIYISKDNMERVYSIIKDYPDEVVTREEERNNMKKKVYASTAYIRKGSVKYILNEYDRRKIYEQDKERKNEAKKDIISYNSVQTDEEKEILKICALYGSWDEENEAEREIISQSIGMKYSEWIKILRKLLNQKSEYVTLKNNIWKIIRKEELIELYAENYFSDDIIKFQEAVLTIIKEEDPKFDLEPSKRIMSNVLGKKMIYSKEIKKSVLETLAIIKSLFVKFLNCQKEIKKIEWYIVREILEKANWKVYASLDELLPLLAEIGEEEFLTQLEKFIKYNEKELEQLCSEKEESVFNKDYTTGLYWSLELLAWNPIYIMLVFEILGKLKKYSKKALDVMVRILLPWYPQTTANSIYRVAVVEMLLKDNEEVGWELLMELMPNKQTTSFPNYRSKWNNVVNIEEIKVPYKELYIQYSEYIKLAIKYSKKMTSRLIELVDLMDDIPEELFNNIYEKIVSKEVKDIPSEDRFFIWNEIESLIARHKKYADADWTLPPEAISKLKNMAIEIKPEENKICFKRFFNKNYLDLIDENDSYEEIERQVLIQQTEAVETLLEDGINTVINFAKTTNDPYRVGVAMAGLNLIKKDEEKIIKLLDTDNNMLARGYIYRKFWNNKFEWFNSLNFEKITSEGRMRALIELPNNKKVWNKVTDILNSDEDIYWKNVDIRYIDEENDFDYPLEKLLNCGRALKVLELINAAIYRKRKFSRKYSVSALLLAINNQEEIIYTDIYHIKLIIKDLQENDYNQEDLFRVEWAYLPILSHDDEYRPITIEKKISENPEIFIQIICMAYKGKKEMVDKEKINTQMAINAYRMLDTLKIVPGSNVAGEIDKEKLLNWFKKMKKLAIENDRLEVALISFGEVLFYAPNSIDGFWIDRTVAEILNQEDYDEIRRGYALKAFNSVGVINVDKEGSEWTKLENKWKELAEVTELEYFRFGKTLRDIANNFREQGEYQRSHYEFE